MNYEQSKTMSICSATLIFSKFCFQQAMNMRKLQLNLNFYCKIQKKKERKKERKKKRKKKTNTKKHLKIFQYLKKQVLMAY